MEKTIKCPICGEPYVFYAFYAGDQSACPDCRNKARTPRKKIIKDWQEIYNLPDFKQKITLTKEK
jgi:hypothetical protein